MNKRCWAIGWDHQFRVYAVRLELLRGGALRVLEHRAVTSGNLRLGERLRNLLEEIQPEEDELLALGGYLPECVVQEKLMPPLADKELAEALDFEVASCFPEDRALLRYAFRKVGVAQDGRFRVRIMAMNRRRLDAIWAEMRYSGIRADILWHPFMAAGPELDRLEIFLPFIEPDCIFKPVNREGIREIAMLSGYAAAPSLTRMSDLAGAVRLEQEELPLSGAYPASLLLGNALLRDPGLRSRSSALLPADLMRRRFRRYRHNIIYLGAICLALMATVVIKGWIQERDLVLETGRKIQEVNQELSAIRRERAILDRRQVILRKFCENITPDSEVMGFIYRLTSTLPDNMYITSFAAAAGRISVTIIYTGERIVLLDLLGTIPNYKLAEDTKTTQNPDNKTSTAQVVWSRREGGRK